MPKVEEGLELVGPLRAFAFLGLDLTHKAGSSHAHATCPFCGKEGDKWSVNVTVERAGLWQCKVCGDEGNAIDFVRKVWTESDRGTRDYDWLVADRGLLSANAPSTWGACRSLLTDEWLVPGFDAERRLHNVYRLCPLKRDDGTWGHRLLPTPGYWPDGKVHGLHVPTRFDDKLKTAWIAEGWSDGMALWEAAEVAGLLGKVNVVAVPGANVFSHDWLSLFADKEVVLFYDNDWPKTHPKTGSRVDGAGFAGARRAARLLHGVAASIRWLRWGKERDGHDAGRPSGFDVRDALTTAADARGRVKVLKELLGQTESVPSEWLRGMETDASLAVKVADSSAPCTDWKVLRQAWIKALKWTEGLDRALSVALACVASTDSMGSQLWIRFISPPSSGKTVLCEAVSVARNWVVPKDTMTGLFSGFQLDRSASEDFSLAAKLRNKTLAIKDADTVLQQPNRSQILSQFRAFYDRSVRTSYGNSSSREYEGYNCTVMIFGTGALRKLDTSELGERWLTCSIMDEIDEDLEDEIGWRVANRACREVGTLSDGKMESRDAVEMVRAKQLTGGFVNWLREGAMPRLRAIGFDDEAKRHCQLLARFVAFMRARHSEKQDEKTEREMSFRLIEQMVRLAKCLALVLGEPAVTMGSEAMRRTIHTAHDSAKGKTWEVARALHKEGGRGLSRAALAVSTNQGEQKLSDGLRFMRQIGVVEQFEQESKSSTLGSVKRVKYKLTDKVFHLWNVVVGEEKSLT